MVSNKEIKVVKGEEKSYLKTNKKGNVTYQNLCVNTKVENVCFKELNKDEKYSNLVQSKQKYQKRNNLNRDQEMLFKMKISFNLKKNQN